MIRKLLSIGVVLSLSCLFTAQSWGAPGATAAAELAGKISEGVKALKEMKLGEKTFEELFWPKEEMAGDIAVRKALENAFNRAKPAEARLLEELKLEERLTKAGIIERTPEGVKVKAHPETISALLDTTMIAKYPDLVTGEASTNPVAGLRTTKAITNVNGAISPGFEDEMRLITEKENAAKPEGERIPTEAQLKAVRIARARRLLLGESFEKCFEDLSPDNRVKLGNVLENVRSMTEAEIAKEVREGFIKEKIAETEGDANRRACGISGGAGGGCKLLSARYQRVFCK